MITKIKENYWAKTPKYARKIGDSLLAAATVLASGGIWQYDSLKDIFTPGELKVMIVCSILFGVVGKFLSNFFKEEEKKEENI